VWSFVLVIPLPLAGILLAVRCILERFVKYFAIKVFGVSSNIFMLWDVCFVDIGMVMLEFLWASKIRNQRAPQMKFWRGHIYQKEELSINRYIRLYISRGKMKHNQVSASVFVYCRAY
jgi:hypothetical protein